MPNMYIYTYKWKGMTHTEMIFQHMGMHLYLSIKSVDGNLQIC